MTEIRRAVPNRLRTPELGLEQHSRDVSPATRSRRGRFATDPDTCLEVFKNHWEQVVTVMDLTRNRSICADDVEPVVHYVDQMLSLLVDERPSEGCDSGPILDYAETELVFERLYAWSSRATGEDLERLKLEQLKYYEHLIGQCRQHVLAKRAILRPLLKLVQACTKGASKAVESNVVLILHQLCVVLNRSPGLLEKCLEVGRIEAGSQFLVFTLLVPYVHREGSIGQHARDALLLIMALSARNEDVGRFVAFSSDFCPVLATGLSGLYSSLPRKLLVEAEDWLQLSKADWLTIPDVSHFLNSLDFCNVVLEVAHPQVKDQLLHFIYSGFLKPVLGAALHQSSMDEVAAATAYLELFLLHISEPSLLRIFLQFILLDYYDDYIILESLIGRIKFSNSLLGLVTMSLFRTLLNMHIEDVFYQLVFRYLIPCNHLMLSQRKYLKDVEAYGKSADKFLTLVPACCVFDGDENESSPEVDQKSDNNKVQLRQHSNNRRTKQTLYEKLKVYETDYSDYLHDANRRIRERIIATRCWQFLYDGDDPPNDVYERDPSLSYNFTTIQNTFHKMFHSPQEVIHKFNPFNSSSTPCIESQPQAEELTNGSESPVNAPVKPDYSQSVSLSESIGTEPQSKPRQDPSSYKCMYTLSFYDDSGLDNEVEEATSSNTTKAAVESQNQSIETKEVEDDKATADIKIIEPKSVLTVQATTPIDLVKIVNESLLLDDSEDNVSDFILFLDRLPEFGEVSDSRDMELSITELEKVISDANVSLTTTGDRLLMSSAVKASPTGFDRQVSSESSLLNASAASYTQPTEPPTAKSKPLPNPHPMAKPPATNFYAVGPFLNVILEKIENMATNSLYTNLLLTHIISDLASYPQPLLKSLLLNPSLVLQPQVKSLYQALNSAKHRIDCFSYSVSSFDSYLLEARRMLHWRITRVNPKEFENEVHMRTDSMVALPGDRARTSSIVVEDTSKKKSFFDNLFSRTKSNKHTVPDFQLQVDSRSVKFINSAKKKNVEKMESSVTKNSVYAAVLLEEFSKELSALCREHSVTLP